MSSNKTLLDKIQYVIFPFPIIVAIVYLFMIATISGIDTVSRQCPQDSQQITVTSEDNVSDIPQSNDLVKNTNKSNTVSNNQTNVSSDKQFGFSKTFQSKFEYNEFLELIFSSAALSLSFWLAKRNEVNEMALKEIGLGNTLLVFCFILCLSVSFWFLSGVKGKGVVIHGISQLLITISLFVFSFISKYKKTS